MTEASTQPELVLTRTFDAPRELVFAAFTDARRLAQCAVGKALRPAAEGGALAEGIRCHVEQHRKVHRL